MHAILWWFRKHLLVIIIIAGSLVISAATFYYVNKISKQAISAARKISTSTLPSALQVCERQRLELQRNLQQQEEDRQRYYEQDQILNDCMYFFRWGAKEIVLPADLFKNAVWRYDDKKGRFYSNFNFRNQPVQAIYYMSCGSSVDIDHGFINYQGKHILVAPLDTTEGHYYLCSPERGTNVYQEALQEYNKQDDFFVNYSFIHIDPKYDVFPKKIVGKKPNTVAYYVDTVMPSYGQEFYSGSKVILSRNGMQLKRSPEDVFYYLVLSNGRIARYDSQITPVNQKINFDDKTTKNLSDYTTKIIPSSCGGMPRINWSQVSVDELVAVGTLQNGEKIYQYKDLTKVQYFFEHDVYAFNPTATDEKLTFQEYLTKKPYFVWIDGFGTVKEYLDKKYTPAVECSPCS